MHQPPTIQQFAISEHLSVFWAKFVLRLCIAISFSDLDFPKDSSNSAIR